MLLHSRTRSFSHGRKENANLSFKYSKQANEQAKKQEPPAHHEHECGHSHDEPRLKREVPQQENLSQKEV
jgi:hypothetical protein